jgi:anaerobic magnesium-protoporphyrin IX monomethyl ester cyclase
MKILLLYANTTDLAGVLPGIVMAEPLPQMPLGLAYIAAVLETQGHEVRIIDNYLRKRSITEIMNEIAAGRPDLVGLSVVCTNLKESLDVVSNTKKMFPDTVTVCGGPQATIDPEGLLRYGAVDYVVVGEGEETMLELTRLRESPASDMRQCRGLFLRDKAGGAFFTGQRPLISDLDTLPLPARHDLEAKAYPNPNLGLIDAAPVFTVSSSRGCPYRCTFCSSSGYWDRTFRSRSAKNIVDEIGWLMKNDRARGINFREDNFLVRKQRVFDICEEMLRREIEIPWLCETRVDHVDEGLLKMMRRAGCRGLWCGVESGSQKVLDFIRKGYTVEQVRAAFRLFQKYELKTGASFMFGFPGESMDDIRQTLALAEEIEPTWASFAPYIGFPRSELYEDVLKKKMYSREWFGILKVRPDLIPEKDIPRIASWLKAEFDRHKRKKLSFRQRLYRSFVAAVKKMSSGNRGLYVRLKRFKNRHLDGLVG